MSGFFDLGLDSFGASDTSLLPADFGSSVGPQSDGTYGVPSLSLTAQPQDAGGGSPGQYTGQVLDIFKYGVGVLGAAYQNQQMLDYKRYEATGGGVYQQGAAAGVRVTGNGATVGLSTNMLLLIGLGIFLLTKKG